MGRRRRSTKSLLTQEALGMLKRGIRLYSGLGSECKCEYAEGTCIFDGANHPITFSAERFSGLFGECVAISVRCECDSTVDPWHILYRRRPSWCRCDIATLYLDRDLKPIDRLLSGRHPWVVQVYRNMYALRQSNKIDLVDRHLKCQQRELAELVVEYAVS